MADKKMKEKQEMSLKIGEVLRNAREKTRKNTVRVSKEICIRRVYLEAIEECRYNDTPGVAYTVGFIRSYAAYLGLNPDECVAQFNDENNGVYFNDLIKDKEKEFVEKDKKFKEALEALEDLEKPIVEKKEVKKDNTAFFDFVYSNKLLIILSSLSIIIFIIGIILFFSLRTETQEETVIEIPAVETVEIQNQDPAFVQIMKAKEEMLKKNSIEKNDAKQDFALINKIYGEMNSVDIKLQAVSEVWIQVTDIVNDKVVFSKILLPGDEYRTKSNKNNVLVVGNAGGIRVIVDDEDLGMLGKDGSRKSNISLDKKELQEIF